MDEFNKRTFDSHGDIPVIDLRKKLARMRGDYAGAVRLDRELAYDPNAQTRYSQEMDAALDLLNIGDLAGARARTEATLSSMQSELLRQPNNSWLQSWLGQAYALLGDNARALEHAQRATEIVPESRDALIGVENAVQAAAVYAWAGQRDHALTELARLLRTPHAALSIRPHGEGLFSWGSSWKPLENDPAFKALLADPANRAPLF
jgi:tetratricopeptide (TPR) repeat protein